MPTLSPHPPRATAEQQLTYLVAGIDHAAVVTAIDEAGYDAVTA